MTPTLLDQARAIIALGEKLVAARRDWSDPKNYPQEVDYEIAKMEFERAANPETLISILTAFVEGRDEIEEAFLHLHGWVRSWDCSFKDDPDWLNVDGPTIFEAADKLIAARALKTQSPTEEKPDEGDITDGPLETWQKDQGFVP